MQTRELRSILAATTLDRGSDAIVETAARVAVCAGAELHLLHVLEPADRRDSRAGDSEAGSPERVREAESALHDQAERCLPPGGSVASGKVVVQAPHQAILDAAREGNADLIVVGAHRGEASGIHFLGTTADRILRSSDVPCLVVHDPLRFPLRTIGVPTDFSDTARGALELAFATAQAMAGDEPGRPPEVRVMHAGWTADRVDHPSREEEAIRPELEREVETALAALGDAPRPPVVAEVRWGRDPLETTLEWAREQEIDLLVLGTHGRGALQRALIGSMASAVARQAPCPVLLVPPTARSGRTPERAVGGTIRMDRVLIGVDFTSASREAVRWATSSFAPEAEHVLLHCVDVPQPPAFLRGRFGSREELVRSAHAGAEQRLEELRGSLGTAKVRVEIRDRRPGEGLPEAAAEMDADLVVVGRHGKRPGIWNFLGDTVERALHGSPAPVLVVQRPPAGVPRKILVAVDDSAATDVLLRWGFHLASRFSAELVTFHVLEFLGYDYQMWMAAPETLLDDVETRRSGTEWLRERLARLDLPVDRASLELGVGDARYEIPAAAAQLGAQLVVVGSRGPGATPGHFLGAVSSAVVRAAPCPVLAVPAPARRRR